MTKLELLSPAKNAAIGIEAIRHGADAVYIGAPKFGARVAAGNSLEDIQYLVDYAHQFAAKVYATINTILTNEELVEAERLIWQLYDIHVDALIVQDVGLLKLNLPPIPLHASTQMDNRTVEKVKALHRYGFRQVVLARELSLSEIRQIHQACPDMPLEVFVHGALCVSYSGQCYVSECLFGRSANRGACAQVCRMEFDLIRSYQKDGKTVEQTLMQKKHLLSLKDMCQINSLQDLIDAGATSFKIEGRLKDMSYVKNVTAAYSEALNRIVKSQPDKYERASNGVVELKFRPDVSKSFNRGFTSYFLYGRNDRIFSFDTPKAMGEEVGKVKEIRQNSFTVAGLKPFANGDGLCFVDQKGKLFGFRLNKVENGVLYPLELPRNLMPKMTLYRIYDKRFEDALQHDSAERYIPVDITMNETEIGFRFLMTDDNGLMRTLDVECGKELARTPQHENIRLQLSKMGGTIYRLRSLNIAYTHNWFIPSSHLSEWRRKLIKGSPSLSSGHLPRGGEIIAPPFGEAGRESLKPSPSGERGEGLYFLNVLNHSAKLFYEEQGWTVGEWAYEKSHPSGVPVMFCKHCIRYSLGWCPKLSKHSPLGEQEGRLFLQLANGIRFRLNFDCKSCVMQVIKDVS
ncbi:MAG: U32 family peptidase [Bacteroidaceae bacterium]|nr:U32 family peptidase [Bacteroidaceae bacterium]